MRKYVTIILGVILIAIAVFTAKSLIASNKREKPKAKIQLPIAFTEVVENTTVPIILEVNGSIVAKQKIELFSEVQGIFEGSGKEFKAGTTFKKGEVILRINSDEHEANLRSERSKFFNALTAIMPDIRLDFPDDFQKWENYLKAININYTIPKLPETTSDKEKFFISGRNVFALYYNVKNLEERFSKYVIRAPFDGIVTESLVNPGVLVRTGQKLGEFINPKTYEMEVAVNASFASFLKVGNKVKLQNLEQTETWTGEVARINGKIDQNSQTVTAFIEVSGKDLREGMYLEAALKGKEELDAYVVDRSLIVDKNKVFILDGDVLKLKQIQPIFYNKETVVVKGLDNNSKVISKPIPNAIEGMKVMPKSK
ncbi:efflux RND transporter periplasmic adaptor subunit [Aureivirga sp. CE67]|uniref:efflux RND transporter periplasmic adaptor subunit n=1 Tax=Aureivirga sp. CE67 TaxID=1788983 RepID=UPI0018C8E656|nr:HlyD family efflux transporter periplasmic adaptor subunit [Aureivirga sp. CE67]